MATVKLSISLADSDLALIDALAAAGGFPSRSAVIQHALASLRAGGLQADYAAAWDAWSDEADAELWDATAADGVPSSPAGGRAAGASA